MATLNRELRRSLETTVREARRIAEVGARKVIEQLAVHHHEPHTSMTPAQRELRNALRAHGRQLGDRRDATRGTQAIDRLTTECAYEHWHRMLFARFLAESNLLIEPDSGMDITLEDCQELAQERGADWLELASQFAERMLPQIFRTNDPVLKVALPPETRSELENLLKALPTEVFTAEDSLGWVYQYWQADKKDEVNRSEKKIGADELPAVTQLFTEDYMVFFLLHNTLGAWWAGKVLAAKPELADNAKSEAELRAACAIGDIDWAYLRFVRDGEGPWRPAAGTFDGWPKVAKDITLLDPCMGSGHFLVFALPMLAAMRSKEESLPAEAAVEAVLRDNLFGLEIDPRCTQIAAFNLAFAAWRRVGYRQLPALHLACSGLSLGVTKAEWIKLAERAAQALPVPPKADLLGTEDNLFSDAMKRGFERLYDLFARAPWLGSLIDPRFASGDLVESGFTDLESILATVMAKADNADLSEMAVAAQGLTKAAEILARRFVLVSTNVPYLGRGNQDQVLRDYCERVHTDGKADLATCFLERCLKFAANESTISLVTPQNWLFLGSYKKLRGNLLSDVEWNFVTKVGEHGFDSPQAAGAFTAMVVITNRQPPAKHEFVGLDVGQGNSPLQKSEGLFGQVSVSDQRGQIANPDGRVVLVEQSKSPLLSVLCSSYLGLGTGDYPHYGRCFWEFPALANGWTYQQGTVESTRPWGGREHVLAWDFSVDRVRGMSDAERAQVHNQDQSGQQAWGHWGVAVGLMRELKATIYTGERHEKALAALIPARSELLPALWCLCSSPEFNTLVRQLDHNIIVANGTLVKIPFDLEKWKQAAAREFPDGMPRPHSDDPTQWLFNGNPKGSESPLQVALARLVGYRWPRQSGSDFPECPSLREDALGKLADDDGIVTLHSVKGGQSAVDRITALLAEALNAEWSAASMHSMLTKIGFEGETLEVWLKNGFFEQHCALFHQRPFVWHIWDGRNDGFHAFVNYHRLSAPAGEGRRTLEKLIYTYLGDWIDRQRADQKAAVEGADARVAAAEQLKTELTNILAGEPPYDIFVRWKPLHEQPIGWEPDINDGVRVNIRPFMAAKPLGARARGACILRTTPKIKWDKDRGKEPQRPREDFPWFWGWDEQSTDFQGTQTFDGNRWNDLHYSRALKEVARARRRGGKV